MEVHSSRSQERNAEHALAHEIHRAVHRDGDAHDHYPKRPDGVRLYERAGQSGREPSAQEVAALVTEIEQHQIPTVYDEPQFNARILELAARDAGIQVKRLYSDSFDDQVKTFLDLMRYDVTSLIDGLR